MDRGQLLNDQEESTRLAFDGLQSSIWTAIPCLVTKVNFAQMTVECQPAIQGNVEDEFGNITNVNLPKLINVPIVFPSAGGFLLTLPIAVDDEVLVIFASRCIDSWWQSGGIGVPIEARMHDLSDGFCIPGPRSVPNVAGGISTSTAQLRTLDGSTYIEVASGGAVNIKGNLTVTGTITATEEITGGAAAIPLSTHTHTSATPGSPTSAPIP